MKLTKKILDEMAVVDVGYISARLHKLEVQEP